MKEKYALLVNPDTPVEEAARWTEKYGLVIRPSQDLRESTVAFSSNDEITRAMLDRISSDPSDAFGLPKEIVSFLFVDHFAATAFLAKYHLVIGYDYLGDING